MTTLLENTDRGLYCPPGDFYLDPWKPVPRAVVTHAHTDHASWGSDSYLTAEPGLQVLRRRLGDDAQIESLPFGETKEVNGVRLSFHSAGHILGSSQVRLEYRGQVAVFTGDYKTQPDDTCQPVEPLRCHLLVSECTFGMPIYRWPSPGSVFDEIHAWWRQCQEQSRTCVLFAYSLGKAQRLLAGLDPTVGPILVHGAVEAFVPAYRAAGVRLPPIERATNENAKATRGKAMVIAPPSARGSPWIKKFGPISTAMASGWMRIRGARRRRAMDRGFVLSDHADWQGLNETITHSEAEEIWLTHGYTNPMARWLCERGLNARPIATRFEGESDEAPADAEASDALPRTNGFEPLSEEKAPD